MRPVEADVAVLLARTATFRVWSHLARDESLPLALRTSLTLALAPVAEPPDTELLAAVGAFLERTTLPSGRASLLPPAARALERATSDHRRHRRNNAARTTARIARHLGCTGTDELGVALSLLATMDDQPRPLRALELARAITRAA